MKDCGSQRVRSLWPDWSFSAIPTRSTAARWRPNWSRVRPAAWGESGFQTLRFNFRGVGRSAGSWDDGRGERDDLAAAIEYGESRLPGAAIAVFGFSFGAMIGLDVGDRDPRVAALVGVTPPVRRFRPGFLSDSVKPKLVVGAGRDSIVAPAELRAWGEGLSEPLEFQMFDDTEHLFPGREDEVAALVTRFLSRALR